jgi:hypothetical protein
MADEHSQTENRAEIISNFVNAGNPTKCEFCKDLELQLSHVLNELSSVCLIVDLLRKEHNRVQSELPSDATMNKQWTQVSYNHQKTPNHQRSLETTERILPQHILETANRFEILTNLSTDIDGHRVEDQSVGEASECVGL